MPVDIVLIPPARVLVITGPNTGGKTVALKTAGLLSLMAQAGLLIPAADGSQIPVFRTRVRRHRRRAVDLGEPEHVLRRTSPTSSSMDKALALPSLVLLDEAGAGTDPVEGGALAMAIIDHFRRRGATVIATTHYDALKSYASTTEGVMAAGFGFNPETFAPTYRLNYGSPGQQPGARDRQPARAAGRRHRRRRGRTGARARPSWPNISPRSNATCRRSSTNTGSRPASGRRWPRRRPKLHAREQELRNREDTFRRKLDERIDDRLRDARREIDSVRRRAQGAGRMRSRRRPSGGWRRG